MRLNAAYVLGLTYFLFQVSGATAQNTDTWSGSSTYNSLAEVTTVTVSATATGNASFSATPTGSMGSQSAYSVSTIPGDNSFEFLLMWDTNPEDYVSGAYLPLASDDGGSGTFTITYSHPVTNPLIHVDRLGGYMMSGSFNSNHYSNSALFTLTTPDLTLTKLSGVDHFEVTSTTFQRTPDENMGTSVSSEIECSSSSSDGMACGTIQVNGTNITTITFDWEGVGVEGAGGDGIEMIFSAPRDSDGDGVADLVDMDDDNDGILDEVEECGSVGTVTNQSITVDVFLDYYPEETDWTLTDENGTTVLSGGSYSSSDEVTLKTATYSEGYGSYTFNITDAWGDGICCSYGSGYYEIKVDGVSVYGGSGSGVGSFGGSDTYTFSVGSGATFSCLGGDPVTDADNDGSVNFKDSDFCTLNIDGVCADLDMDNDGIINSLDTDSDGDGTPDAIEGDGDLSPDDLNANDVVDIDNVSPGGVDANGIPNFVGISGQGVGVSQSLGGLPIELLSFGLMPKKEGYVKIIWQTLMEANNDYFTIERSVDAENWEEIIEVKGAGNSEEIRKYEALDQKPIVGTSYYRLKQTDFNGDFAYFHIMEIQVNTYDTQLTKIYPNPTKGHITLEGSMAEIKAYRFYDLQGRDMNGFVQLMDEGNGYIVLDLTKLAVGIYILETPNHSFKVRKE